MREIFVDLDLFLISQKRKKKNHAFFAGAGEMGGGEGGGKSWVFLGGLDLSSIPWWRFRNSSPSGKGKLSAHAFFVIFGGDFLNRGKTLLVGWWASKKLFELPLEYSSYLEFIFHPRGPSTSQKNKNPKWANLRDPPFSGSYAHTLPPLCTQKIREVKRDKKHFFIFLSLRESYVTHTCA